MSNLRLTRIKVSDSTTIKAEFTSKLDSLIGVNNITVSSNVPGVPDSSVLKVVISGDVLIITVKPLTPFASYFVTFKSTIDTPFKSQDGQSFLFEDGNTNVSLIDGPQDPEDDIKTILLQYLKGNVYSLEPNSMVDSILNSQSGNLSKALHDIGQLKNDNYLEILIENEPKTRSGGPYDRLNEEGAFEILRVGLTESGTTSSMVFNFDSFPSDPITLLGATIKNEIISASDSTPDFNKLTYTVNYSPVTIINKITVFYQGGGSADYDINKFGYQLKNPNYDKDHASTYLLLNDNQFRLNDIILNDDSGFQAPTFGDTIYVDYQFKSLGRIIDESSIVVSQILDSVREITPPLKNDFALQFAPIVTDQGTVAINNGVIFLDPLSSPPFSGTHPAFTNEIPYKLERLPAAIGEYSIDYKNGKVFVYGQTDQFKDGSGNFPPTATYKYIKSFDNRLDYTFNPDTYDLAANPLRELATQAASISFNYEQTLIPGVDFKAQVHEEVLNERIENRLKTLGSLGVLNIPITNCFRLFNETSGEIYPITRFNDNTVFFSYNNPPRILNVVRERAKFTDVLNELLILDKYDTVIASSNKIYNFVLSNNRIISGTEDGIGSSFNSSALFSRTDIFKQEIYYDSFLSNSANNLKLTTVGQYQIDYRNGIVHVLVDGSQNLDVGTINYKKSTISSSNIHLITVANIYYSISPLKGVNKTINYNSFSDSEIVPIDFDVSDERFLNGDTTLPYIVFDGSITVMDNVKNVRGVYDEYDLANNIFPTNFSYGATTSSNIIQLNTNGVQKKEVLNISSGNHIVATFITSGAEIVSVASVVRSSDGAQLWDNSGTFSSYNITLSGLGSPITGQQVTVIYNVQLNGGATPIVDYNRGDYFIDYSYLADEILISYEYGDNLIDFRESNVIDEDQNYFVTYKVGALRDALLKNFGTLVNIPIMNSFDTSLSRENYRHALQGALQSFSLGPTIPAIKKLVSSITKIDPELTESIFDVWSLGVSKLFQNQFNITGSPSLLEAKFDSGVLIDSPDQTITFPISSNLRLEDGALRFWAVPEWNGLDNDATLTFSNLLKDGYATPANLIFIGAGSFNPTFDDNGNFSLNKNDEISPVGLPSAMYTETDGLFIGYDPITNHWYMYAKSPLSSNHVYSGNIISSGEVYDANWVNNFNESTDTLRTFNNKIQFSFNVGSNESGSADGGIGGYTFDGMSWMADNLHYFFDFGKDESTERFSLYKDGRGYLNFKVWDKGNIRGRKNSYSVSADISTWLAGEKHLIGVSWRLNSSDHKDEMHLFIDGFEVPNIMRYGGRPIASSTDRFRTVKPEIVAGTVAKKSILGKDLHTVAGSNIVYSDSVNFQTEGIVATDTIEVLELGFESYTITNVSGFILTLSATAPSTLDDARFSVNELSVVVSSEIDLESNIAVSILTGSTEVEIPGLRADLPSYRISKNSQNQNVLTVLGNANVGDQIVVRTLGLNHRRVRERTYVWGNTTNILKTQLPSPINLDEVKIYPVLLPLVSIGPSNSTLSGGIFTSNAITTSQPSNSSEGRTLAIRMTGTNVNFGTTATVQITGTTNTGPTTATVSFTQANTQNTPQKWRTITSIIVAVKPNNTAQNSVAIEIKEAYSITNSENNTLFPVIRFSFKTQNGVSLSGTGNDTFTDLNGLFEDSDIGNNIVISSPGSVSGTYLITGRIDSNSITVSPPPATSFSNGVYSIYNVSIGRSGFQNGFFTLETAGQTNVPYYLNQGLFEFDYSTYLEISFNPMSHAEGFIGSDLNGANQAKAIIDEFVILSKLISDVRVGESLAVNEKSFTTDFTALRQYKADSDTLVLLRFNDNMFMNEASFYTTAAKNYIQSGTSINSNFNQSVVIKDKPLIFDNVGLLSTASEGSIEFWVSPIFDTYNDPNLRFYFDASGSFIEQTVSITNGTVKVNNSINSVISVRLITDTDNSGVDYFAAGSVANDFKTINLGIPLPYQQTPVKIVYTPSGLTGDRISIYKDDSGFITFNVRGQGIDYQVRQPVFWARDTWHRVKATYLFNSANNRDEIRLFIDGEERGIILFGTGLIFGTETVFGQGLAGLTNTRLITDINFKDPINQIYIGSDFTSTNGAQARIDNFKISDIRQPSIIVAGQARDLNYSSNVNVLYPAIPDAFTTFLMNFDQLVEKNEDFSVLRDELFGIFNFTLKIIDSFGIVIDNAKLKQILESLIFALKPAQSKAKLEYIE